MSELPSVEKDPGNGPIIPGYTTIFDDAVHYTEDGRDARKVQYAEAERMLLDSKTVSDVYASVRKVIDLPPVQNEVDIQLNLSNLVLALNEISPSDERTETELMIKFIENDAMPKLIALTAGSQK